MCNVIELRNCNFMTLIERNDTMALNKYHRVSLYFKLCIKPKEKVLLYLFQAAMDFKIRID